MNPTILLADDHVVVREGLRNLLANQGFEVIGEASNGREAVELTKTLRPQIAVLDLSMPLLNGLDAARQIRHASPLTKVVLLTMHNDYHFVLEALNSEVRGYVLKSQAASDLVLAIREVGKGSVYLSPEISRHVVAALLAKTQPDTDVLSPREREVLQLVAEGKSTKEIAGLLQLSVKTAETHRANVMKKLDLHNTAGLVRYAIRRGFIEP